MINNKCSCKGSNLDKLIQPAILTILANESLCGYQLVQRIAENPILKGQKPDTTGVYRMLKKMKDNNLVISNWNTSDAGPAKRVYKLTDKGKECLHNWIYTLEHYRKTIGELLNEAKKAVKQ